ncbi:hypothetical protein Tco_0273614 [Tanacetum coccineum]
MDKEEDDDITNELYKDVNVNLGKKDAGMTHADQGGEDLHNVSQESGFEQVEEDAYVTLTAVHDSQKTKGLLQSSSVSSDFTSKLLNMENISPADNEIDSLMDTTVHHEEPSSQTSSLYTVPITIIPEVTYTFTTIIPPPPPFFNPLQQHATPTPTPTTSETTSSFPALPDFSSIFNDIVTSLEKDLSEMKQVDHMLKLSPLFLLLEEVKTQLPQILPKAVSDFATPVIEQNVTESLEAVVLAKSSSQPKSTYAAAASLSEFKLTKILMDKMEEHKSHLRAYYKKELYDALVKSYNTDNDLLIHMEPSHTVDDSGVQQNQEFDMGNNDKQLDDEVAPNDTARAEKPPTSFDELIDTPIDFSAFVLNRINITNLTQELLFGLAFNLLKGTCKSITTSTKDVYSRKRIIAVTRLTIMKGYDYGHLDEIEVRREDQQLYTFKEGDFPRLHIQDIKDMLLLLVQQKLTNLMIDERYDLNVALRMFTRRIVIERRVEDLQLGVESYQKKLNLTEHDTFRSDLKKRTAFTAYSDPQGTALYDIASGIRMEYLPKRKWSGLDKRKACLMIQDIDKQLFQRRLMRNLEKFVGGRKYGEDLRLLERAI